MKAIPKGCTGYWHPAVGDTIVHEPSAHSDGCPYHHCPAAHPDPAYRLTPADEVRIAHVMTNALDIWMGHRRDRLAEISNGQRCSWMLALTRVGIHSIGCTEADLRDSELDWIEGQAEQVLQPDGWKSITDAPDWPRWTPPEVESIFHCIVHVLGGPKGRCYPCYSAADDDAGLYPRAFQATSTIGDLS